MLLTLDDRVYGHLKRCRYRYGEIGEKSIEGGVDEGFEAEPAIRVLAGTRIGSSFPALVLRFVNASEGIERKWERSGFGVNLGPRVGVKPPSRKP